MQSEVRWKNASFGFFGIPKSPFVLLTVIARVLVAGCSEVDRVFGDSVETSNGVFVFATALTVDESYCVSEASKQKAGQISTVTGATGAVTANVANIVSQYTSGSDGALTPMARATVNTGLNPYRIETVGGP